MTDNERHDDTTSRGRILEGVSIVPALASYVDATEDVDPLVRLESELEVLPWSVVLSDDALDELLDRDGRVDPRRAHDLVERLDSAIRGAITLRAKLYALAESRGTRH